MENPFEAIERRLSNIEAMLIRIEKKSMVAATTDDIIDLHGAAELLKVTTNTIYSYVYKKAIPVMKRRGRLYFSRAALTEWITSSQRKSREEIRNSSTN